MELDEYIRRQKNDNNLFWRLSSGRHEDLLDQALERIDELSEKIKEKDEEIKMLRAKRIPITFDDRKLGQY